MEKKRETNGKRQRLSALIKNRNSEKRSKYDISSSDRNSFSGLNSNVQKLVPLPINDKIYSYTKVLFDAFNAVDLIELEKILRNHCTHDIAIIHQYDGTVEPTGNELRTEFYGREVVLGKRRSPKSFGEHSLL